jgi:hypothetical protein
LDEDAARRLRKAASLNKQSQGAFLEQAGEERARQVLLKWAVARHRNHAATFAELADETGLAIEEIMAAMQVEPSAAADLFLSMSRVVAEAQNSPEFLHLAEAVAQKLTTPGAASPQDDKAL